MRQIVGIVGKLWVHRGENQYLRPAGATRCTDSRQIQHVGSLKAMRNFTSIGGRGWVCRPPIFSKDWSAWANPLTDFYNC